MRLRTVLLQQLDRSLGLVRGRCHVTGLARRLGVLHETSGLRDVATRSLAARRRASTRPGRLYVLVTARRLPVLVATRGLDILVPAGRLHVLFTAGSRHVLLPR